MQISKTILIILDGWGHGNKSKSWGHKISKGETTNLANIKDIAPSISSLLEISFPNGCTGKPLIEVTK